MATPVHASLLELRDLDGNSVADAYYDSDLNLTWLLDANVNGAMFWADAVAWAQGFTFAGYDDWRLPVTAQPDPSCSNPGSSSFDCTGSEMGHFWYVELGNTAGNVDNVGDFLNLQDAYWSETDYLPDPDNAWAFGMKDGLTSPGDQQAFDRDTRRLYAMAVRVGDTAPAAVPEARFIPVDADRLDRVRRCPASIPQGHLAASTHAVAIPRGGAGKPVESPAAALGSLRRGFSHAPFPVCTFPLPVRARCAHPPVDRGRRR